MNVAWGAPFPGPHSLFSPLHAPGAPFKSNHCFLNGDFNGTKGRMLRSNGGGFWLNPMPHKPLIVVASTLLNWKPASGIRLLPCTYLVEGA